MKGMPMPDIFLLFVLAHITGDFVLQTNKIARMKSESIEGTILHSGIVTGVQVLFLGYFGARGIAAAIMAGIAHFGIDYCKLLLNKRITKIESVYFLFDQLVHLCIIWLLSYFVLAGQELGDTAVFYIKYAVGLITAVYIATVFAKSLVRDTFPDLKGQEFFKGYERPLDALVSVIFWLSLSAGLPVPVMAVVLVFLLYQWLQRKLFAYSTKASIVKYFGIFIFSILASLFV
jgi:hypothetical protein